MGWRLIRYPTEAKLDRVRIMGRAKNVKEGTERQRCPYMLANGEVGHLRLSLFIVVINIIIMMIG